MQKNDSTAAAAPLSVSDAVSDIACFPGGMKR